MPRRICDGGDSASDAVVDFPGLGCNVGKIVLQLGDGKNYEFNHEKALAEALLRINDHLRPAVAMLPSGLSSEIVFAQCSFPSSPHWKDDYEEISGVNNFLRNGSLIGYMRAYNVTSLITTSFLFARQLYGLNEPRIQRSLFLVDPYFLQTKAVSYQDLRG